MCDWIDNEIKHIADGDVVAPECSVGEFETQLVGATVPMRLRKMYTRVRQLYVAMELILKAHGLLSDEEEAVQGVMISPPSAVALELRPMTAKAAALESAICENLIGEYDLWQYAAVAISNTWDVYYRTYEQEEVYQQYLEYGAFFEEQEETGEDNQGFEYPSGPFDPNLN